MKRLMKWAGILLLVWMMIGGILTIFTDNQEPSPKNDAVEESSNKISTSNDKSSADDISNIVKNKWDFTSNVMYSDYNNYLGLFITVDSAWNEVGAMEKLGNRIVEVMRLAANNNLDLRVSAVMPTTNGTNKVMMLDWDSEDIIQLYEEGVIGQREKYDLKRVFSSANEVSRDPAGYDYTSAFCEDRDIANTVPMCAPAPYRN